MMQLSALALPARPAQSAVVQRSCGVVSLPASPRRRQRRAVCLRARPDASPGVLEVGSETDQQESTSLPVPTSTIEPFGLRPTIATGEDIRSLLRNRPAHKLWVQRWWAANSAVACELLLTLPEADVDVADDRGETKLLQAARLAQTDVVKVLLKYGADANIVKGFDMNEGVLSISPQDQKQWANLSCRVRMPDDAIRLQSKTNHDTALHVAIGTGGVEMVRALCEGGANVHARTKWNNTPLMVAARLGSSSVVRELLARGARAEDTNADGHTALHFAASRGSIESVQALLEAGAEVDARDLDGCTPLYFAATMGSALCIRDLLAAGAKTAVAHRELGFTPLIAAVQRADADSIRLLCAAKADVAARDAGSLTAMHWAAKKGTIECVRSLALAGADSSARDRDGNSPLHFASSSGNLEAVVALIDARSDPNAVNALGLTPLMLAASAGYLEIARALLVAGADPKMRDEHDATALHYAVGYSNAVTLRALLANRGEGTDVQTARAVWQQPIVSADDSSHLAVLNELVSAGADVNARDRHGDAAIAVCCQNGYQQCVAALLDAGAHPGATPGRSPMSYAARFGAAGCIRVLRKFNAEVAHKDAREAWTPLHDAAETGFVECVRALLDIGASVNACDGDKMTPLHVAARFGQADCARVLLLAGAIVDARNTAQETPLIVAAKAGHAEVVRALMEAGADQAATDSTGRNAMSWATKAAVKQQLRSPSQRIALLDDIRTRLASAETLAAMRAAYTADQASALERERRAKEEALAELAVIKRQLAEMKGSAPAAAGQQPAAAVKPAPPPAAAQASHSGNGASNGHSEAQQPVGELNGIISGGYGA